MPKTKKSILIIFLIGLILGLAITLILEELILGNKSWCNPSEFFNYKIHHSFVGLMLGITGLVLLKYKKNMGIFLISFGLGMIIIHTIYDGRLVFIEKLNSYFEYIKNMNFNC